MEPTKDVEDGMILNWPRQDYTLGGLRGGLYFSGFPRDSTFEMARIQITQCEGKASHYLSLVLTGHPKNPDRTEYLDNFYHLSWAQHSLSHAVCVEDPNFRDDLEFHRRNRDNFSALIQESRQL
jgi:hypothetical protein